MCCLVLIRFGTRFVAHVFHSIAYISSQACVPRWTSNFGTHAQLLMDHGVWCCTQLPVELALLVLSGSFTGHRDD